MSRSHHFKLRLAAPAPAPDGEDVLLGLGANLGDPLRQLAAAVRALSEHIALSAVSAVYRTEPVGLREQPDFYNLVCLARTPLSPPALLGRLLEIEAALGRVRGLRDGPRMIDLDLLAYGSRVLRTEELALPHPRMHQRAFVLVPLAEVAPGWRHPVLGRTAVELLAETASREQVERWGDLSPA